MTWRDDAESAADEAHEVLRQLSAKGGPDSARVAASRALIDLAIANPPTAAATDVLDEESAAVALEMIVSSIEHSVSGTIEQRAVAIRRLEDAAAAVAALNPTQRQ